MSLPAPILRALKTMGFDSPTPIQAQAIPVLMRGRDLIGVAQTGTGKTAAFGIPMLADLLVRPGTRGLILAPTRELAQQIEKVWQDLTRFTPDIHSVSLIGGASMQTQLRKLGRRPRVIVATPGRLCDHIDRRTIDLSQVSTLVLDEADRMLDMGFAPQLNRILQALPRNRQTLFFTATWGSELDELSRKYLKQPERVQVGTASQAAPKVSQNLIATTSQNKNSLLLERIGRTQGTVLVFARTQHRTDRVARYLAGHDVEVGRIHGGRSQGQRNSALNAFRSGEIRVLVATDIAARGIDVSQIELVINYDLPQQPADYIHRIGRTGRNGETGDAISFVTPEDRDQWRDIAALLKKSGSTVPLLTGAPLQTQPAARRPGHPPQDTPLQGRKKKRHRHRRSPNPGSRPLT